MPIIGTYCGVGAGSGATSELSAFKEPLVWFDFTDSDSLTLTGSELDEAANKGTGGSGYDLLHNSGVQITVTGGEAVCNGSQNDYRSGAAGDYDFLHDGTGSHVFYIIEHDSTDTGENLLHVTNVGGSSSSVGSRFTSDQASDNNRYRSLTGYGGGVLTHASASNTLPEDVYTIAEQTIETVAGTNDIVMRDDGVLLASNTDGGLLSGSSHADVCRFLVSGACKVKGILVFNRRLSEAERKAVYRKAASYYSLPAMNVSILIGDSNAGMQNAASGLSANYSAIIPYAYTWAHEDGNTANDLAFWPMEASHGGIDGTSSNAGPELPYAYTVAQATGEKEYMLKSYENGSDLFAKWHPSDFPELNSAWDDFVDRVNEVKSWASQMGRSITWRGCWQILGHNDCGASFRADNYQNNLADLNAAIRDITRSDLPIVVTVTSLEGLDNPDAGFSAASLQATVRAAIQSIANTEANTYAYQPLYDDPLSLGYNETTPDGVHYDTATMEKMGEQVGAGITASSVPTVLTSPEIDTTAGASEGDILTLKGGVWTNGALEVGQLQVERDNVDVAGETAWQYTLVGADDGTDITYAGTAKNIAGAATEFETAAVSIAYDTSLAAINAACVFDLDATIADSYGGTGQVWKNLVSSPADGEIQTAYDFHLGNTSGASTNDPTFNGTAGDPAAYWSFDGGDYFQIANGNTTLIDDLHIHPSGQDFTLIIIGDNSIANDNRAAFYFSGLWGTGNTSGYRVYTGQRGDLVGNIDINLEHRDDAGGSTNNKDTAPASNFDGPVVFGIAIDHANDERTIWANSGIGHTASTSYPNTSNVAGGDMQLFSGNGANAANGMRGYAAALFNKKLSDAEFQAVIDEYESRHGRTYL